MPEVTNKRPPGTDERLADRGDRLAFVGSVLLKLREVVIEGQVNDAFGIGSPFAKAVKVFEVAVEGLGPCLAKSFGAGL